MVRADSEHEPNIVGSPSPQDYQFCFQISHVLCLITFVLNWIFSVQNFTKMAGTETITWGLFLCRN